MGRGGEGVSLELFLWGVDGEQNAEGGREEGTYPAYDLVVVGEVRLACFAAVDAFGVEVDVVGEAHAGFEGYCCFIRRRA